MTSQAHRSWRTLRWLLPLVLLPVLATIAVYFSNPLGTATTDPRARLLGYMMARIPSESMLPTLSPGDVLLVDTTAYRTTGPATGDVLVYRSPLPRGGDFVHRVVAVPGDQVTVRGGNLWVNGMPVVTGLDPEEWPTQLGAMENTTLAKDQYYVVGDNARRSADSRLWGTVPRSHVIGRASHVVSGVKPGSLAVDPGATRIP